MTINDIKDTTKPEKKEKWSDTLQNDSVDS